MVAVEAAEEVEGEEDAGAAASSSSSKTNSSGRTATITSPSTSAREAPVTTYATARDSSCRRSWRTRGSSWSEAMEDLNLPSTAMTTSRERRCDHVKCSSIGPRTDLDECSFSRRSLKIRGRSW